MQHVYIMAQGSQQRMQGHPLPKQWLPLSEGVSFDDGEPILLRTLRLIGSMRPGLGVTVIAGRALHGLLPTGRPYVVTTLGDPGNTVLAGIRQAISPDRTPDAPTGLVALGGFETNTILLGDVVYSRAVLRRLLRVESPAPDVLFMGTPVIGPGVGEIWGVTWGPRENMRIRRLLAAIKTPPFQAYQPGQLRELLWAYDAEHRIRRSHHLPALATDHPWYAPTTDYTADIDTPADLAKIPALARAAQDDDQQRGGSR